MNTEMHYSLIANFRGIAKAMCIKIWISSTFPDPICCGWSNVCSLPVIAGFCLSMCNISDYQMRAMPKSFLGNQRKAPPTQIFHFGSLIFLYFDIWEKIRYDAQYHQKGADFLMYRTCEGLGRILHPRMRRHHNFSLPLDVQITSAIIS
jgi:hypothetical protein